MILIFDLDGTISDPSEGITASLNFALDHLGRSKQTAAALTKYIGPSLFDIFSDLLNTDDDARIQKGISLFRKRYGDTGYKENVLYPDMKEILTALNQKNHTLYIATTKKPDIARAVADHFNISYLFKDILGCGTTRKKTQLIDEIKQMENNDTICMIGDRFIDMTAGKETGCLCVGVLWGFGSKEELVASGADILLNAPEELLDLVHHNTALDGTAKR